MQKVALKNIDGLDYWSIYHWCDSVPEDYDLGQLSSTAYRQWADKSFWKSFYDEAMTILRIGFESTGDSFLQNRLNGITAYLKNYKDDAYHSGVTRDWNNNILPDYFNVGDPIPFDEIMGFSGFYVEAPSNISFRSHDYYAFLPDGQIVFIGGSYGYYTTVETSEDSYYDNVEEAGDHIVDIDNDGISELICNCIAGGDGWLTTKVFRMRDGVIERGTLDYDLFLSDVPTADWRRRIMDHYDPKTNTFEVWYTTTPENGEVPQTKRYSSPDVYSFIELTPETRYY